MGFRENLQFLRAQRNFTQERLAMLLGVSRQAISKWESGKAYPEMDKLLMMCDLFGCTLDDLVLGDVQETTMISEKTDVPAETLPGTPAMTSTSGKASLSDSTARVEDVTGYDAHICSFAWRIAAGVGAIVAGVGFGELFDADAPRAGVLVGSDFLMFLCVIIGVMVGLAFLIPTGMAHKEFKRRHPFVEDFYTEDDRGRRMRELAIAIVVGIGMILVGVMVAAYSKEALGFDDGWPSAAMLLCVAMGVFCIVCFGIRYGMMNIGAYNRDAESDRKEREREKRGGDFYDTLTGTICGIIMLLATIVALWLLFVGNPIDASDTENGWRTGQGLFWVAWPIGGVLCGVVVCVIAAIRSFHDRNR